MQQFTYTVRFVEKNAYCAKKQRFYGENLLPKMPCEQNGKCAIKTANDNV